jgi:hypothetical protein
LFFRPTGRLKKAVRFVERLVEPRTSTFGADSVGKL